jgi:acetyl esterase/lipase
VISDIRDQKQNLEDAAMADDVSAELKVAQEVIRLWPDGPPRTIPDVGAEAFFTWPAADGVDTEMLRNISDPTLTVFRPDPAKANGIGVVVAPGGGWRILAWRHEGIDLAEWLAARGYTAFLLKYRVMGTPDDPAAFAESRKPPEGPSPYEQAAKAPRALAELTRGSKSTAYAREIACDDGVRAVELVRERAGQWNVTPDKIGMIGFSAGAFLAVDVAMTPGANLAFVAPIYGGETSGRPVAADAPPLFTTIAEDDRMLFKVVEGLYADWSNADRPAEVHIFTRGGHGFGMVRRGLPVDRWIDLMGDWLADQGFA